MYDFTKSDFENKLCENKTVRAVYKIKTNLEEISSSFGLNARDWGIIHVCTAWNVIRQEQLRKFTPNGWITKMKHFKNALAMLEVKAALHWEKELKLYLNNQLKTEIDTAAKPYKKRAANMPPYSVWKKMIEDINNFDRSSNSAIKILRAEQGCFLLILTLSSGARLDELLRLRRSDVTTVTKGGYTYLELTVRRGKASRLGRRPTYLKCFENKVETAFCPILGFINYVSELINQKLYSLDDVLLFPSSAKFNENAISRKAITDQWKSVAARLNVPKEHVPQAHSGHALLINTAWAFDQNDEQLLDITNWNSIRNLPEYVEAPKENSINVIKTNLTAEELDKRCEMVFH